LTGRPVMTVASPQAGSTLRILRKRKADLCESSDAVVCEPAAGGLEAPQQTLRCTCETPKCPALWVGDARPSECGVKGWPAHTGPGQAPPASDAGLKALQKPVCRDRFKDTM
jgi:hypothetical protein